MTAIWQKDNNNSNHSRIENLNSTARPYDQQVFSPPDPTAIWHSHLALAIYIFVVVTYIHTYRQTDRQTDRQTERQKDIHTYIHTYIQTYIHTYMFVVANFDAFAQASDIRIERRQFVFLCWKQDSNPSGSQTPNRQQTECPLTNRLSYRELELDSPSLWSASIQPTRPHSRLAFAPGSGDMHVCCC